MSLKNYKAFLKIKNNNFIKTNINLNVNQNEKSKINNNNYGNGFCKPNSNVL